jgi:hypothetical protein
LNFRVKEFSPIQILPSTTRDSIRRDQIEHNTLLQPHRISDQSDSQQDEQQARRTALQSAFDAFGLGGEREVAFHAITDQRMSHFDGQKPEHEDDDFHSEEHQHELDKEFSVVGNLHTRVLVIKATVRKRCFLA